MTSNIYQCTTKYWSDKGISIVPCFYRSKYPHSQALIRSNHKRFTNNGIKKATWLPLKHCLPNDKQIHQWFKPNEKYNLALITTDKLIVLDFDNLQEYAKWFCWQSEYNPKILNTYIVSTSRGLHLYYWLNEPLDKPINNNAFTIEALNLVGKRKKPNKLLKSPKEILPYEIKSHGRLITIPPSVHPSGTSYKAINSPNKILTVDSINDVLTFSPVEIKRAIVKKNSNPWQIKPDKPKNGRVDLLAMFPEVRQTDTEGRYFLSHCPFHGNRWNFWLDIKGDICGCYGGCMPPGGRDVFLATELAELIGD